MSMEAQKSFDTTCLSLVSVTSAISWDDALCLSFTNVMDSLFIGSTLEVQTLLSSSFTPYAAPNMRMYYLFCFK